MIELPFPPTANSLFVQVSRRRIRTEAYKAWAKEAGWMLLSQRPRALLGPYRLTLIAHRPDNRKRDISNLVKAVEDLLVEHRVVQDDSFAKSVFAEWSDTPPAKPGSVRVSVVSA